MTGGTWARLFWNTAGLVPSSMYLYGTRMSRPFWPKLPAHKEGCATSNRREGGRGERRGRRIPHGKTGAVWRTHGRSVPMGGGNDAPGQRGEHPPVSPLLAPLSPVPRSARRRLHSRLDAPHGLAQSPPHRSGTWQPQHSSCALRSWARPPSSRYASQTAACRGFASRRQRVNAGVWKCLCKPQPKRYDGPLQLTR